MVGMLGCGCCESGPSGCCSLSTPNWTDTFSTTPAVGDTYDHVENISGSGARSYCPPPINSPPNALTVHKTSRLQIDCDSESPLYLGLNGTVYGSKFTAGWISSTNASAWTLPPPLPGYTGETWMGVYVFTELIFKFDTVTYYSGSAHSFYKRRVYYGAGTYYDYSSDMNGYKRINSGGNIQQTYISGGRFTSPRQLNWDVQNMYEIDDGSDTCEQFKETKQGRNYAGSYTDFRNLRTPGPVNSETYPLELFNCFVGWQSIIQWWTYAPYGVTPGVPFDFKNEYVSWKTASWMPYMP